MRLLLEFSNSDNNPITLPVHYNYLVQSAIYATLDSTFAAFLHDIGFEGGGRRFKLFTFSRLTGVYRFNSLKTEITYTPPLKLVVSSPVDEFCQSLVNRLLAQKYLKIGSAILYPQEVKVDRPLVVMEKDTTNIETEIRVKTLSPVVVYSTFLRPEGEKYTCYFQPGESDFSRLVQKNLYRKYQALYGDTPPEGDIRIKPLHQPKLHIIKYKNIIIKGYSGVLSMTGPASLLQLAVDAGLGAKNSMGFGLLEIISN